MSIFESVLSGFFSKEFVKAFCTRTTRTSKKNTEVLYVSQKGILTYFIFGL